MIVSGGIELREEDMQTLERKIVGSMETDIGLSTIMLDDDLDKIAVGVSSVIGKRREQQDAVRADDDYSLIENGKFIAVLCDGMGGLAGGQLASNTSASHIFQKFHEIDSRVEIREFYKVAIAEADRKVFEMKNADGTPMRAGTTLASVVIKDDCLHWASVGDSRIYLIRNGIITCLTHDHNYLMQLMKKVEAGQMRLEEAQSHPKREALVSYIGMGGVKYTDMNIRPVPLMRNDYIVICSDGLYRTVEEKDIKDITLGLLEPREVSVGLTEYAMAAQKKTQDNTSVIVVQYKG